MNRTDCIPFNSRFVGNSANNVTWTNTIAFAHCESISSHPGIGWGVSIFTVLFTASASRILLAGLAFPLGAVLHEEVPSLLSDLHNGCRDQFGWLFRFLSVIPNNFQIEFKVVIGNLLTDLFLKAIDSCFVDLAGRGRVNDFNFLPCGFLNQS